MAKFNNVNEDKKRKILLIGTVPPEVGSYNYGGVARVVWRLANALKEQNINFCVGAIGKYFKSYQEKNNIKIYGISFSLNSLISTIWVFLSKYHWSSARFSLRHYIKLFHAIYFLNSIKRKISFDIIHVHHVINQIPLAAKLLNLDVKIVATIHSYTSLLKDNNRREIDNINMQLRCVHHLTHVSKHLRYVGISKGIKWKCEDEIIYNGIKIYSLEKAKSNNQICFVGTVSKAKGIEKLISSLKYINRKNLRLIVIGKGAYIDNIKEKKEQFPNDVKLLGQLNHTQALKAMAESQVLVNPSKSESFGLVYLEALSVGTPVIGYGPILREFKEYLEIKGEIKKWVVEFDFKKENSKDLARKISNSLQIKTLNYCLDKKQELIKGKIKEKLCWDKITANYINIYKKIG
ncbi:Glycosyltransferase involved in cell wall bisynthesis [Fodinibius roseus]|uniref:Glycosyltransferase involved in cell wall bisynthesis n=1 Tax=Fodinibius roseus TaxID=1194090 RepID=A0A1M5J3D7_9BACT|nr:glycosyltransferase family 4 protein [Fodinibius roseus]SHG35074.1 Glycosyltransferase involved in cell wall bisynthesis [Fodinibius roseus]